MFTVTRALPFGLDAVSFGLSAALVASVPGRFRPERDAASPSTLRSDIAEGLRWLFAHPVLRPMAWILAVWNFVVNAAMGILVLFAEERLGVRGAGFGVLLGASALGAVGGGLVASHVAARLGESRTFVVAVLVSSVAAG